MKVNKNWTIKKPLIVLSFICFMVFSFNLLNTKKNSNPTEIKEDYIASTEDNSKQTNDTPKACNFESLGKENSGNKESTKNLLQDKDLTLYINSRCPYCDKVLAFIEKNNVKILIKNTDDQKNKEFLLNNGGKTQVPCLFIKNRPLYESDDIIAYIDALVN